MYILSVSGVRSKQAILNQRLSSLACYPILSCPAQYCGGLGVGHSTPTNKTLQHLLISLPVRLYHQHNYSKPGIH